jgi:heme/copper-type cytochrome/quinol oxidase subunit 3
MEAMTSLVITLVFATVFTLFQLFEYTNASFSMADGVYGSTFYLLTGLHGFHVIVGTLFLMVALVRIMRHHYTQSAHIGYECAA